MARQPKSSDSAKRTITYRDIESLKPYVRNPRTHSDEQISQIAASISRFGFNNPILLDGELGIIAGHGRLRAAQQLGMTQVPCIDLHGLTAEEQRAYVIADNQLALNAGWDYPLLAMEMEELATSGFDVTLIGFSDKDMALLERLGGSDDTSSENNVMGGNRFLLMIEFENESDLQEQFEAMTSNGFKCKVLQ